MLPRSVHRAPRLLRLCKTASPARSFSNTSRVAAAIFKNEPTDPKVTTELPGPKAQVGTKKLDKIFDTKSFNMLVDYNKCIGN